MNNREKIQEEALDISLNYKKCGLNISMGVGKTLIGIKHMNKHFQISGNGKLHVVAPKKSFLQSWKDELEKHGYVYLFNK
jgi:superfamily II DNA or RNA helicase